MDKKGHYETDQFLCLFRTISKTEMLLLNFSTVKQQICSSSWNWSFVVVVEKCRWLSKSHLRKCSAVNNFSCVARVVVLTCGGHDHSAAFQSERLPRHLHSHTFRCVCAYESSMHNANRFVFGISALWLGFSFPPLHIDGSSF